jgi:hypothetical protein
MPKFEEFKLSLKKFIIVNLIYFMMYCMIVMEVAKLVKRFNFKIINYLKNSQE